MIDNILSIGAFDSQTCNRTAKSSLGVFLNMSKVLLIATPSFKGFVIGIQRSIDSLARGERALYPRWLDR